MTDPIEQKAEAAYKTRLEEFGIDSDDWWGFIAGFRAAAEEGRRHDCESWRDEGVCCANCNPTATALPWPGPVQTLINQAQAERDELKEHKQMLWDQSNTLLEERNRYYFERDEALEALRDLLDITPADRWHDSAEIVGRAERVLSARVSTSPNGVRQTTPTEILKSEKGL